MFELDDLLLENSGRVFFSFFLFAYFFSRILVQVAAVTPVASRGQTMQTF